MIVPEYIQKALDTLNEALRLDRDVVSRLIDRSIPISDALADLPNIPVRSAHMSGVPMLSALGLINGALGQTPCGHAWVVAHFAKGLITHFSRNHCPVCHAKEETMTTAKSPTVEIERRFLINPALLPPDFHTEARRIEQFYLSHDPVVRLRRSLFMGRVDWELTVKGPGRLERVEVNTAITRLTDQEAKALKGLANGSIDKTRFYLKLPTRLPVHPTESRDQVWEIDQFHGVLQGLWLAEVELKSTSEGVSHPAFVVEDVTEHAIYTNSTLSRFKSAEEFRKALGLEEP